MNQHGENPTTDGQSLGCHLTRYASREALPGTLLMSAGLLAAKEFKNHQEKSRWDRLYSAGAKGGTEIRFDDGGPCKIMTVMNAILF
jgi:hypothetical protein